MGFGARLENTKRPCMSVLPTLKNLQGCVPFIMPRDRLDVAVRNAHSCIPTGRALTVSKVGALSDLDNITVRIADVAADLAVLGDRLRDELRSSTFP